ncbi:MAG: hypothetical protein WC838_03180 [Candidatus Margulisiibacteriota bacterium]|jgi:hypothetical protein
MFFKIMSFSERSIQNIPESLVTDLTEFSDVLHQSLPPKLTNLFITVLPKHKAPTFLEVLKGCLFEIIKDHYLQDPEVEHLILLLARQMGLNEQQIKSILAQKRNLAQDKISTNTTPAAPQPNVQCNPARKNPPATLSKTMLDFISSIDRAASAVDRIRIFNDLQNAMNKLAIDPVNKHKLLCKPMEIILSKLGPKEKHLVAELFRQVQLELLPTELINLAIEKSGYDGALLRRLSLAERLELFYAAMDKNVPKGLAGTNNLSSMISIITNIYRAQRKPTEKQEALALALAHYADNGKDGHKDLLTLILNLTEPSRVAGIIRTIGTPSAELFELALAKAAPEQINEIFTAVPAELADELIAPALKKAPAHQAQQLCGRITWTEKLAASVISKLPRDHDAILMICQQVPIEQRSTSLISKAMDKAPIYDKSTIRSLLPRGIH